MRSLFLVIMIVAVFLSVTTRANMQELEVFEEGIVQELAGEETAQDEIIPQQMLSNDMFREIKELKKMGPLEALAMRMEELKINDVLME